MTKNFQEYFETTIVAIPEGLSQDCFVSRATNPPTSTPISIQPPCLFIPFSPRVNWLQLGVSITFNRHREL